MCVDPAVNIGARAPAGRLCSAAQDAQNGTRALVDSNASPVAVTASLLGNREVFPLRARHRDVLPNAFQSSGRNSVYWLKSHGPHPLRRKHGPRRKTGRLGTGKRAIEDDDRDVVVTEIGGKLGYNRRPMRGDDAVAQ